MVVADADLDRVVECAFTETSDEHWAPVWNVNVTSAYYVCRTVLRHLGEGGRAGYPANVATAAEYFARLDSGFVTGTVLRLNGRVHFS